MSENILLDICSEDSDQPAHSHRSESSLYTFWMAKEFYQAYQTGDAQADLSLPLRHLSKVWFLTLPPYEQAVHHSVLNAQLCSLLFAVRSVFLSMSKDLFLGDVAK